MSKTPISWLGLIKMKLAELKSAGKSPSIGDVTPEAKKEWVQIKEGKHPKFIQGKTDTFKRGKKTNSKTKKMRGSKSSNNNNNNNQADIYSVLNKCKICPKCKKNIEKYLKKNKKMSGGFGENAAPVDGSSSGCSACGGQNGGCGCGSVL
jgi:hypothetical protein